MSAQRQNNFISKNNAGFVNLVMHGCPLHCTTANVTEVCYLKLPEAKKLNTGKLVKFFSIRVG
jgi:hypothetical protein